MSYTSKPVVITGFVCSVLVAANGYGMAIFKLVFEGAFFHAVGWLILAVIFTVFAMNCEDKWHDIRMMEWERKRRKYIERMGRQ